MSLPRSLGRCSSSESSDVPRTFCCSVSSSRRPMPMRSAISSSGRLAAELGLELVLRALELARLLAHRPGDPVERPQRVEDRAVDPRDRVRLELDAAGVVVLLDRVDQTDDAVVDEVVEIDVGRQIDRDAPRHVLHQVKVAMDDLFARVRGAPR